MPIFEVTKTRTWVDRVLVMAPDEAAARNFEHRSARVLKHLPPLRSTVTFEAALSSGVRAVALPTGIGKYWAGSRCEPQGSTRVLEYTEFDDAATAVIRAEMILVGSVPLATAQ